MNPTANYGLCVWEPSDRVLMDDFNSDHQKIDTAIKAAADSAAAAGTTAAAAGNSAAAAAASAQSAGQTAASAATAAAANTVEVAAVRAATVPVLLLQTQPVAEKVTQIDVDLSQINWAGYREIWIELDFRGYSDTGTNQVGIRSTITEQFLKHVRFSGSDAAQVDGLCSVEGTGNVTFSPNTYLVRLQVGYDPRKYLCGLILSTKYPGFCYSAVPYSAVTAMYYRCGGYDIWPGSSVKIWGVRG